MIKNKLTIILVIMSSVLAHLGLAHTDSDLSLKERQAKLTPEKVIKDLMEGNSRYVAGELSNQMILDRIEATKTGQYPKAVILSCIDSRVPVEMIFDQTIGDIFVGRVAGNVEDPYQLGSMEFAVKYAGVKLVMVLGHEACGAVKGACDNLKDGNLTELLYQIQPAIDKVEGHEDKGRNSKNGEFVAEVIASNVAHTVDDIRERSPIIKSFEDQGKIKIVGALYSLSTGKVTLLK